MSSSEVSTGLTSQERHLHSVRASLFCLGLVISLGFMAWTAIQDIRIWADVEKGIGHIATAKSRSSHAATLPRTRRRSLEVLGDHGRLVVPTNHSIKPGSEVKYFYSKSQKQAVLARDTYFWQYLILGGLCLLFSYCAFDEWRLLKNSNEVTAQRDVPEE